MMAAEAPRIVTRKELLDIREGQWRELLEVVSLAVEAMDKIKVAHRDQALGALGDLHKRQLRAHARELLLRRWPAVHVLATAGVAADHYAHGTFWPKLASLLGVRNEQSFQREWGDAFLANLRRLDLPTFDQGDGETGSKYVGRILMHAGMPTYCLQDFFKIVSYKRSVVPGLTPETFVSWAATRAASAGLQDVDKPVQRFLRFGQEFAVDVSDRAFDLLDAVAAGGSGEDVPLPKRFRIAAQRFHERRGIAPIQAGISGDASRTSQPRLAVDPFGQALLLRLPAVGDAPDGQAIWVVTLDGDTQRVTTQALWPGSTEPAPETDVAIHSPVRTATAALAGREHLQVALSVVDDKNPLLAFGEDGLLLAPGLPIPARPTWLLFPGESNEPAIDGEATILSESPLPPGWAGWSLQQRDLTHATNITVAGSHRVVRSHAAARIEVGEPVRGVRTSNGHLVVTTIPTIKLPEHLSDANWEVVLLSGSGEPVARWSVADQSGDPNSVWDEIARPIVGTFTVRVRGPWGRGATRTVTIVEDLDVRFTPSWRRFAPGGLQPGMARLSVANGMEAARTSIEFCERDREAFVRVGAHREFRTLVITPPHMTVAYQSAEVTSSPSVRPLGLFREDIAAHPGTLVLDVGTAADPTLYTIASGKPIQSITPSAGRAGIYRFDLSKLVDTLAGHPLVNLTLSADGALTVATVRPRRLFREATLTDGCLEFADCVPVEGLTAFAYPARAPWREPAVMPVVEGQVKLPAWLSEAGPVRVLVRIEDPWAPLPVAEWPDRRQSTLVGCDGWVIDDDDEGTALSAFLAGVRDFPSEIADFTRLWTVRGLLPELGLGPRIKDVADAIDAALHENPRPALLALSASRAPSQTIPALVIRAGLAWANLEAAHDDAAPPWSVRSALPATLLSAADSQWSDEEVDAAVTVCGDVVSELLRGKDRFASSGRFDAGADLFDREPTMREEFVRQAGLIPRGLLSGDSRVIAAMELVKDRQDARLQFLTTNAHKVLAETERMVRILAEPVTQALFDARRHPTATGSWRVVPSISFGLALVARHAARGHQMAAGWLPRQSRVWADLASVVPQMVTIDLIVAELLVASSTNRTQGDLLP